MSHQMSYPSYWIIEEIKQLCNQVYVCLYYKLVKTYKKKVVSRNNKVILTKKKQEVQLQWIPSI